MTKVSSSTLVDTQAGKAALALAIMYRSALEPRLPPGTLEDLEADVATVEANPSPSPATESTPATPETMGFGDALTKTVTLTTAIYEALRGAKATLAVRKAYGAGSMPATKDAKTVIGCAEAMVARARANPAEALSMGILPSDISALAAAVASLKAANATSKGTAGTAKEKQAAATRMHDATARIAGAGVLAFASDAKVRSKFAALKATK